MATRPEGATAAPDEVEQARSVSSPFEVHLENFTGPFDLLLGLISKHKLDITEVALAQVTDEFIAAVRAAEAGDEPWELNRISEFLVVAATLLDLKAARLLPAGAVEDAEDLEMLEARDLLFARLLQYRAYKDVALGLGERLLAQSRSVPREVGLEPDLAALLPELVMEIGPTELAVLAAHALRPRTAPTVDTGHLHAPAVSVREQAAVLVDRLRRSGSGSFRTLVQDAESSLVVVVRFLALLELYREGAVGFDQVSPLGDLTVRWTGGQDDEIDVVDDYGDLPAEEAGAVVAGPASTETPEEGRA
ncbi:segregation/condensation protein A [Actinotalea sp. BY-33]|uniref:Segregation and condensation protein A n=1 Tax=Actinotalea soli TaxID=2819234 RepID=A0A939LN27_9CELL|nr:segregation/condensation protein A [Actinotalea soli]MBO1750344.1 segregation/condensation protein A [Actinotalea soli]